MTARPRRWLVLALAPLVAVTMLLVPAGPANADPDDKKTSTADDGEDDPLLNEVLDSTGRRFVAAKSAVAKSTKTQLGLALKVKDAEARRDAMLPEVGAVAAQQYRTGGISTMGFLLNTDGPEGFLKKAVSLEEISALNDGKLHALYQAIDDVNTAKARLDQEVKAQQQNLAAMKKQKQSAEKALAKVGGNIVTGGFVLVNSPVAAAAPRNSDGEFSPESCSVNDPTTSGCITPRTFHMYKEVKKANFKRFVGCHRNGGPVRASEGPGLRLVAAEERLLALAQPGHPGVRQQPDGVPGAQRRQAGHSLRHLEQADLVPGDWLEVILRTERPHGPRARVDALIPAPKESPRPGGRGLSCLPRSAVSCRWPAGPGHDRTAGSAAVRSAAPAGWPARPASPG
nr:hypothetical protein GCM10020092_103630 [Actinoplanes digitatis]